MIGPVDALGASSFTARRSAASNLPGSFELPPPPLIQSGAKLQPGFANSYGNVSQSHSSGSLASVGNLLTPPNTGPDGLSPASPSGHAPSSTAGPTSAGYAAQSYWPQQAQSQGQYAPYGASHQQQWIPPRGLFPSQSASLNSLNSVMRDNGTTSPSADGQSVHSQQSMFQLPSFGSSLGTTPGGGQALTSGLSPQPGSGSQSASHASPSQHADSFSMRQPPTPTYFNHQSAGAAPQQHQQSYQYNSGPSPTVASPLSASSHHSRMSSHHHQQQNSDLSQLPLNTSHQSAGGYSRPFGQHYHLPAVGGPVMTNMHSPTGQMSLVGSMGGAMVNSYASSHATGMHGMYGVQQQQQQQHHTSPPNDRPFKCDQCMQSFNRNHDLKRHKRIHLAVKPFPCGHCDKSFSRKDALKRHILVKGCGKAHTEDQQSGSRSSASASVSPRSTKRHSDDALGGDP